MGKHIAEMRRITRAWYHRAVRHIMREDDIIRSTKMAEAISENRNRDLWSEVRRIKGRNKFLPSNIDGVVGDEEIAQLFSDKYKQLKLGKLDGEEGFNSNHIIHGPKILFVLLALIFNSMLEHGFSPTHC